MSEQDRLREYLAKRDFRSTSEPQGDHSASDDERLFVIQKHEASTTHYDLRLSHDGVLKSWAVPKGPSTDPGAKRLAIATEDHPLDYARFEGVIPEGEYGAGVVLVWDAGRYRNLREEKDDDGASMKESLRDGKVEVWLEGEKVNGGYALVRTPAGSAGDDSWLLVKMDDEGADRRRNPTGRQPRSVLSGRTIDEIRADGGRPGESHEGAS